MNTTTLTFEILNAEMNVEEDIIFSNNSADSKPLEVYVLLRSSLEDGLRVIGISYKLDDSKDVYQLRMLCKMSGGTRFLSTIIGKKVRAIVQDDDKVLAYGYPNCDVFALHNTKDNGLMSEAKAKALLSHSWVLNPSKIGTWKELLEECDSFRTPRPFNIYYFNFF